jgi:hypothetical protein
MPDATCKRLMRFCGGYNATTFYACEQCRHWLENGDVIDFYAVTGHAVAPLSLDDVGLQCEFCEPPEGYDVHFEL